MVQRPPNQVGQVRTAALAATPPSPLTKPGQAQASPVATVQWAGLLAVANAQRALVGQPTLGTPHAVLYGQVAALPGLHAQAFSDINSGSNGDCASCTALHGYDTVTGLSTPRATALLALLTQTQTNPAGQAAPVPAANVGGPP